MGIANSAEDGDEILENDGLKVFLEREANKMLSNATIDFSDEQGFAIDGMDQSSCQSSCQSSSCQ
jgi:Fe-S cluster assembly iron-binding protein IscA